MKTISNFYAVLVLTIMVSGCNLFKKKDDPVPIDTTPAYQKAIDAKFVSMGWDKDGHSKFNNSSPVKTAAGKGWVQYYAFGNDKSAIYYFEGKGAFAMNSAEMNKYDKLGQDNFAYVESDPKSCGNGCGYNDILMANGNEEGIILLDFVVTYEIYKKYKALNRWDGPLGIPINNSSDLSGPTPGKWQAFSKNKGQIYVSGGTTNGAQAFWGKIGKLYGDTGFDGGWLGLPIESCDINKGDNGQSVAFKNGRITIGTNGCGNYYSVSGSLKKLDGAFAETGFSKCY